VGFLDRIRDREGPKQPEQVANAVTIEMSGAYVNAPERTRSISHDELVDHFEVDGVDVRLVELEIVGERYRQDALAAIAGPKGVEGRRLFVGALLRCEPTHEDDAHALRVEVMGQLVGYVDRVQAELLSPAIQRTCAGTLEARGVIVGGWKGEVNDRHYDIRVWITTRRFVTESPWL
jgi:hypothetical protein